MRTHRVVVLDVLTKHPPEMLFVDRDDMVETLAPERADDALGDGVGIRRVHRSQNRLDPEPSSACDEVSAIATVAVSDEEPWLLTPGGRLDYLLPDPGRVRMLRDVPVPDAAPVVVDHDEHVERAEGERLDREQIGGPDAGRVVAEKRAPRLARGGAAVPADGSGSRCERSPRSQAHAAHQRCGRRPTVDAQWRCAGSAAATRRECGDAQVRDDSSSASRRAKQNDATAPPCPARPSRACLASRTNHVPAVTRVVDRGSVATTADGPLCRRRADAAAPSARGRDLGGRGPMRRVLRQADGGRAQTSLSWLADTLLSQHRTARIKFCRPTGCSAYEAAKRLNALGKGPRRAEGASLRIIRALSSDRTPWRLRRGSTQGATTGQ